MDDERDTTDLDWLFYCHAPQWEAECRNVRTRWLTWRLSQLDEVPW